MIRHLALTAAAAALAALSGAGSADAAGDRYRHGGYHDSGRYDAHHGHARDWRCGKRGHRHARHRYDRSRYARSRHDERRYARSHSRHGRGYGCHEVYKTGYFRGRKAKIGGTQCYRNGRAYIVSGSRYVIRYY